MMLGNSITTFEIYEEDTNLPIIVGFDGFRYWSIPSIIKTKCKADVVYFPFDFQVCRIEMGSWTYHNKMINIVLSSFETGLEGYVGNIEWEIIYVDAQVIVKPPLTNHPLYPNESLYFKDILYSLVLKRKPYFYVHSLIVPSLLLAWLGSVIFLLPNECGEKLSFATTLFLALYVNQVVVSEFLPPSADSYPLIAKFYTLISVMLGTSIFFTASTLMLHFRLLPTMPRESSWTYKVLHQLEKLGQFSFFVSLNCNTCVSSEKADREAKSSSRAPILSNKKEKKIVNGNLTINDYIVYNESYMSPKAETKLYSKRTAVPGKEAHKDDSMFTEKLLAGNNVNNNNINFIKVNDDNNYVPRKVSSDNNIANQLISANQFGKNSTTTTSENELPRYSVNQTSTARRKVAVEQKVVTTCSPMVDESLQKIVSKLEIIAKDDSAEIALKRWRLIAAGFDRILFVIYIMQLTAVTLYFGALIWNTDLLVGEQEISAAINATMDTS
ncbi:uncharacterized protein LOC142337037 [Convolutriloba macropyga]|uniref:uncharacterized protein LOC142337037 n=1 Tax=Convolutriloba macropyga TaxID=536237 RepID=UPI003F52802A